MGGADPSAERLGSGTRAQDFMSTTKHPSSVTCIRFVRCVECGVDLGEHAFGNLCVPCQKIWAKRIANPKNFEGREFKWQADWFVPVQMATGHMMVHCIAATARAAWDTFTMHYWTKKERMAQGWRVKRIRITPDWTPNAELSDQ